MAWSRGKKRSGSEYEDEIVSAIFDPILYMPERLKLAAFIAVAKSCKLDPATYEDATECQVEFWPNLRDAGRCEPDLVVELRNAEKNLKLVMVIEAKWGSQLGNNQLSTQWKDARSKYGSSGTSIGHILLTKEPKTTHQMLGKTPDATHAKHLRSMSWSQLAGMILKIGKDTNDPGLSHWARHATRLLERLGHAPFIGAHDSFKRHKDEIESNQYWMNPCPKWKFHGRLIDFKSLIAENSGIISHSTKLDHKQWKFKK